MGDHDDVTAALGAHYDGTFARHGATGEGVDWGPNPADHLLRLDRMLAVMERGEISRPTLLDVGCGFGSLLDRLQEAGQDMAYTGIDVSAAMIAEARRRHPEAEWIVGDILEFPCEERADYVVCNGILTQKLSVSQRDMDAFLKSLVRRIFNAARVGVAFNIMTTHVNFMAPNLYYRNPAELLAWCMSEVTPCVRLDHAYPLFEYTLYLYHTDAPGLEYGAHRAERR